MSNDNQELNELLKQHNMPGSRGMRGAIAKKLIPQECPSSSDDTGEERLNGVVQWTSHDNKRFIPASKTAKRLLPGAYEICHSQSIGLFFQKFPVKTEGLLRFPQTNSERVVREIQTFWEKEPLFREYGLAYKRGVILYGPAGSGKSCCIQLIMKDVIEREGIVIKFGNPTLFIEGMRILREIEPKTPVVVLMEDIDGILESYNESEVLNILDGVDHIDRLVFLSTTNYPERLGARIINRPSRFDKRFKIGHPNAESRRLYFKHIIGTDSRIKELKINLEKWVTDTKDFSIAHLKELFIAVAILGDDYKEAIETLASMKDNVSSAHDEVGSMGFGTYKGARE